MCYYTIVSSYEHNHSLFYFNFDNVFLNEEEFTHKDNNDRYLGKQL